jgi:hypothetical protein
MPGLEQVCSGLVATGLQRDGEMEPGRKTGLGDIELLHIFVPHLTPGFS